MTENLANQAINFGIGVFLAVGAVLAWLRLYQWAGEIVPEPDNQENTGDY
jgi:hypothetical protein